jgi:Tol biopolymer transport system component
MPSSLQIGLTLGSILALSAVDAGAAPVAPEVFAPGAISGPGNDAAPAFTPDDNTVVFCRNGTLLISHKRRDAWSRPEIAPFSGEWGDQQPAMSPDGAFLVFVSNRPVAAGGKKTGGNLWKVQRTATGWGTPVHLSAQINRGEGVWAPSVAGDGSVYFIKRDNPGAPMRIWRSQLTAGEYQPPVAVSFGDASTQDVDPAVAPDESFIVFGSMHPGPDAHERLYIAFRAPGGWGAPIDLGAEINGDGTADTNEARLGADHRTLYFSTDRATRPRFPRTRAQAEADLARIAAWDNGTQNIWRVSLVPWLERTRG